MSNVEIFDQSSFAKRTTTATNSYADILIPNISQTRDDTFSTTFLNSNLNPEAELFIPASNDSTGYGNRGNDVVLFSNNSSYGFDKESHYRKSVIPKTMRNIDLNPNSKVFVPKRLHLARRKNLGNNTHPVNGFYLFCLFMFLMFLMLLLYMNSDYIYTLEDSGPEPSPISLEENDSHFSGHTESVTHNTLDLTPIPVDLKTPEISFNEVLPDQESSPSEKSPHQFLQSLRMKNADRIIFGHLNINSIRNKIEFLGDIVQNRIDILLISETKIDASFPKAQFYLNGYADPYRLDRNANGGGLLLYIRDDITSKPLPLRSGGIECIFSELMIAKKKWLMIGAYNPQKVQTPTFLKVLGENLSYYLPHYDNIIMLGDFNCEVTEDMMDEFTSLFNLRSLIKTPTCFKSEENPSCIDLILTNRINCFQNSSTIETGLSDFHHLVFTVMKTMFRKKPPKIIRYRNFKNYVPNNYLFDIYQALAGINLNVLPHDDFDNLLIRILEGHAPLKTKYVRGNDQPFMTKQLRKEHMKRTRLLNRYRKNRNAENETAYKRQRNLCTNLLKKAKSAYYGNLHPSKVCDNKKFWNAVKPLFSDKCISSDPITLIEKTSVRNEEMVSDDKQTAAIFNRFFSNAVRNLDIDYFEHFSFDCVYSENEDPIKNAIEKYSNHPSVLKIRENYPRDSAFSFQPTNMESVFKEIRNLDESKSSPLRSMPARILKDIIPILCPKIVRDFNFSIQNGLFPQNMKLADVAPVFKKNDKHSKGNFRPVSLLSSLSKVFERLMLNQMHTFMAKKLSIFLCAYQKFMNAQNCLLFLVEKWRKGLDCSKKCGVLLTDLSKAFDCLVHDLLIAKLHAYGFDYLALKLIYSYLTGRKQRVRVNASFSEWANIDYGVPQGSILGPELYNYYSNDLFLFMILEVANYADDNSPFGVAPTIPKVIDNLEADAKNLLSWIRYNGLKANPDKFHLLLSEIDESLSINVNGFDISNSLSQKLIGILLDNKVSFKNHVTGLCTTASQQLHALSRVSNYMDLLQRKTITHAYILSQFGYCPLVWMLHSRQLNNRINKIHERALRIIYRESTMSFEALLAKDKSFTIHERNIQTLAIELYKVAYGISPKIMRLIFPTKPNVNYPWGNIFQTFNVRTVSWGTESLSHLGPKIWNIIPLELKKIQHFRTFKRAIRLWKPEKCPCRMCKTYIQGVGFVNIT